MNRRNWAIAMLSLALGLIAGLGVKGLENRFGYPVEMLTLEVRPYMPASIEHSRLLPQFQIFGWDGSPLAGGRLYQFKAGTSEYQFTFMDCDGSINPNPITLDSHGMGRMIPQSGKAYRFIAKDSAGRQIWSLDNAFDYPSAGCAAETLTSTGGIY